MKWRQAVLTLVRQWPCLLALVAREPWGGENNAATHQIGIDALRQAGPFAHEQGQNGPVCTHGSRGVIGRRQLGGKNGRVLGSPLSARKTHESLRQRIDAGPMGVRTLGAETGDVGLDQARVQAPQVVRTQAHALGRSGPQVGQQYVGGGRHLLHDGPAFRLARVEAEGALVDINVEEIRTPERPRNIAGMGFHLDDVAAQVGQQPAGDRAGDQVGDFQYPDSHQRQLEFPIRRAGT